MNIPKLPHTAASPLKSAGRGIGLKLLMVCALVLLMGIPAAFISLISYERSSRAKEVTRDVSEKYGGAQTVLGPVLVAPYFTRDEIKDQLGIAREQINAGEYIVFAEQGAVSIPNLETEQRKLSLYSVTTYKAGVSFDATFNFDKAAIRRENIDWSQAKILIGMSNVRGLQDDVFLTLDNGAPRKFSPAIEGPMRALQPAGMEKSYSKFDAIRQGMAGRSGLNFMSVDVGDIVKDGKFTVSASLPLSGASHISLIPFAQSSKADLSANWPHPGFDGVFPPTDRDITEAGFSAQWSVPYLARGIPGEGAVDAVDVGKLTDETMQVSLVQLVSPYQTVNRALKYAVLFIGLVFIAFFLFEVLLGKPVHAAQYVLIGLAQSIFYLLLLALSEQIGFGLAFGIASGATVGLTALYAGAVFGARQYALKAGAIFAAVYGLLFVLMRIEDFALLVGAVTSFVAIAATMYLTRNLNWYGGNVPKLELQD